jgi:hypothetical protein
MEQSQRKQLSNVDAMHIFLYCLDQSFQMISPSQILDAPKASIPATHPLVTTP